MFLEYQGNQFEQRDNDNYVNLTEMAKPFNRFVKDWAVNKRSQAYLEAVSSLREIPLNDLLVYTSGSNSERATWAHPLVAIAFAQWLNPHFHVWCNLHIKHLIEQQALPQVLVKVIELNPERKVQLVKESVELIEKLGGGSLRLLPERDRVMYTACINNVNREVLYGSNVLVDPDERPLSFTEIADHIYGVRVKLGSKRGCDAHLGAMMVKQWRIKYGHSKDIKPEQSIKYMSRHLNTTHASHTMHELKGVYVYHKEDWHLVGELLKAYGYTISQAEEFMLPSAS
jgi:hypothetical protein